MICTVNGYLNIERISLFGIQGNVLQAYYLFLGIVLDTESIMCITGNDAPLVYESFIGDQGILLVVDTVSVIYVLFGNVFEDRFVSQFRQEQGYLIPVT